MKKKQKPNRGSDLPKIIIAFVIIFMYAMLIWAIGYILTCNEPIKRPGSAPEQNKCMEKAKVSMTCSAVGYEFDPVQGKCTVVNGGGCIDKLPFGSMEECRQACEIETEIKSAVIGEEFLVTLDANPSTGYSWTADFDENYLMLRSKDFVFDKVSPEVVGAGGKEVFTFAPIKAGETTITMGYGRPWESKPSEIRVLKYIIKEKTARDQTVAVSADKREYEQGEIIKIVVNNGSNKPILYSGSGERFWGIEYFKDNKWINSEYEEGGDFQLTEKNTGDVCNIDLFERMPPKELTVQSNLTAQWNQKICLFGTEGPDKPKIVRYIGSGRYRLAFGYGFEISGNDPFRISEPKTVYSDEFTIKDNLPIDSKCIQKVEGYGMCKAFWEGIEFDHNIGQCVKRGASGCSFETPFENVEECRKTCEMETEKIDFYACEKDSDCISVKADCCGCTAGGAAVSINIKYRQEWNEKLNCAGIMCPAVMSDDPSCSQKPKCINSACTMN